MTTASEMTTEELIDEDRKISDWQHSFGAAEAAFENTNRIERADHRRRELRTELGRRRVADGTIKSPCFNDDVME